MKAEHITQFVVAAAAVGADAPMVSFFLFFHRKPPSGLQTMCRPPEHSSLKK